MNSKLPLTVFSFAFLMMAFTTKAYAQQVSSSDDPCVAIQSDLGPGDVWSANAVPGSTKLIARCTLDGNPKVQACVATATPQYPQYSNGPFLAFKISPFDNVTMASNGQEFFSESGEEENDPVSISGNLIQAKSISIKGVFGTAGRFGGRGGSKVFLTIDLDAKTGSFEVYSSDDTMKLPFMIDWTLLQKQSFHCEAL